MFLCTHYTNDVLILYQEHARNKQQSKISFCLVVKSKLEDRAGVESKRTSFFGIGYFGLLSPKKN